jgi:hypothetical protein
VKDHTLNVSDETGSQLGAEELECLLEMRATCSGHAEVERDNEGIGAVPLIRQCPTCFWRSIEQGMLRQHGCKTAISVFNNPDKVEWIGIEMVVDVEV